MKTMALHHDVSMPLLGFGTWQLTGEQCRDAVHEALATGYRHLDTALMYGNHRDVVSGQAASDVTREDVFITSKIWRDDLSADGVERQMDRILEELEVEYVDLTLIHWPNRHFDMAETLQALDRQRQRGKTRAIGVSNFTIAHLKEAFEAGVAISANQVEYHPSLNQDELRQFCRDNDIALTAYSPLAQGDDVELPLIQQLAEAYQVTPGQVVLNWLLSKGIAAIPRSSRPTHIRENFRTENWQLAPEDIASIDAIGGTHPLINPSFAEL